MLNLKSLQALCAVATHTSLTRAAISMSRSQPALTLALDKLDEQVGIPLTDRNRSGAQLTPAGTILHVRTMRMFDKIDSALHLQSDGARNGHGPAIQKLTDSQLRLLVAMANHDDIDSAARSLGITMASLRRTARSLEATLDETLFETIGTRTNATQTGAELARKAKLAVAEVETALDEIAIAQGRVASRISIGMVPLCATGILTAAINEFLEIFPSANISITHGPYRPLLHDLRFGRIDILYGVLRLPAWVQDVKEEALFHDNYAIAVRRGHPLIGNKKLQFDDLAAYEWIAPPRNTPRRESIEKLFSDCARKPEVKIETSSLNMQRALLMGSDRITLLTAQEMAQEISIGALQSLDLRAPIMRRNDGIATRADWHATLVQQRFIDILRLKSSNIQHVA